MDAVKGKITGIGLAQEGSALPRTLRPRSLRHLAARNEVKKTLNLKDNPSVQGLLDVIVSIIADEYIEIAKKNRDIFLKGGGK